ncbi:hypothetical protein [Rhodospirillum sp. A1_3_36]|uniref:hypothetical protein n=1 Tax=Rhodospirillum sp. A1_3_36 TaxID=3391666 RepID=UPI0039A6E0D1
MTSISAPTPFPSSLLMLGARSSSDNRQSTRSAAETNILKALKDTDPEKAKALEDRLDTRDRVLQNFIASTPDPSEQRKARAREKIEEIKQKLQALRMLANINPEAAARQAAQLAKELSSAVQQYSGGGVGLSVSGANVSQPTMSSSVSAPVSSDASAPSPLPAATQNDVAATGISSNIETAAGSTVPAPVESKNGATPSHPDSATDGSGNSVPDGSSDEGTGSTEEQATLRAIQEKLNAEIAKRKEAFGDAKADADFASTVDKIKNALKSILETAKRKLKETDDAETQNVVDQGQQALQKVDTFLKGLGGLNAIVTAPSSINILV